MDVNDLRSAVTLLSLALFIGIMTWTWWPKRRDAHAAAAQLPFFGEFDGESDVTDPGARQ